MSSVGDKAEVLRCLISNKELSSGEELFLTISPDETLMVDLNKELPSKHICLECRGQVIDKALGLGVFQDAFGKDLKIPTDFANKVLLLLHKKAQNMLCMARKSGLLVLGFEKVNGAIKAGEADFILKASDGKSDASKSKILEELKSREPIFHHPEKFGKNKQDIENQMCDELWEVGASGNVYTKQDIIETLCDFEKLRQATWDKYKVLTQ